MEDTILTCPLCDGDIYAEDVDLTLTGPEIPPYLVEMGRCEQCGQLFALLPDLLDELMEDAISPADVEGFHIDGAPMQAGLWTDLPLGVVPWESFRDYIAQLSQASAPPPKPDAVRDLPLLSEPWELALRRAGVVMNDDGEETPSFIALLLDPAAGIRQYHLKTEAPHDTEDLARLVLEATVRPQAGTQGRPRELRLDDEALATTLAGALAEYEIPVRDAATPQADAVLHDMLESLGGDVQEPFFTAYDADAVQAYFQAAKAFFKLRPWTRIADNKYVGFRFGDESWRYLSVIGHIGEEYGISLFDDWMQLCRLIHNQPTMFDFFTGDIGPEKGLEAAGAMEGLTLEALVDLPPEDSDYLEALKAKPVYDKLYPYVRRFSLEGLEPPQMPLPAYRALLEALAKAIQQRRAKQITSIKQTLEIDGMEVTLRYPAKGNEAFDEEAPGSYRLILGGVEARNGQQPAIHRIVIDAPGTTPLDDVAKAIQKEGGHAYFVTAFLTDDVPVWTSHAEPGDPCPYVAQLAKVPAPALEFIDEVYPIEILPRMGASSSDIQVQFASQ